MLTIGYLILRCKWCFLGAFYACGQSYACRGQFEIVSTASLIVITTECLALSLSVFPIHFPHFPCSNLKVFGAFVATAKCAYVLATSINH